MLVKQPPQQLHADSFKCVQLCRDSYVNQCICYRGHMMYADFFFSYTVLPSFISDVFLPESWLITQDELLCSFGTQLDSLIIIAVSLTRKLFLSLAAHRCKTSACMSSITAAGPLHPLKVIKSSEVIILKCKLIYSSFKHAIQESCPLNIL